MDNKVTDMWIGIGFALLGGLIGSIVGILYGWLFAEIFKAILQDSPPQTFGLINQLTATATTTVKNWGVAVYSTIFVGLGWVGGFIIGGMSGLLLPLRMRQ